MLAAQYDWDRVERLQNLVLTYRMNAEITTVS